MNNNEITDNNYAVIHVNGTDHRFPHHIIELLGSNGIIVNDNYINDLKERLNYKNVFNELGISYLVYCDYHTRILFSKDKGFGDIYEYDEYGAIINHHSSVFDAAKNSMPESIFGLERLDSLGKKPCINKEFVFYGKRLERYICLDDSKHSFIFKHLNRTIRKIRYYLFDSKPTATDKALYYSFIEADTIIHTIIHSNDASKKADRKMLSIDEYLSAISPLKSRYSYKNNDLLTKVDDLRRFDCPGIYILCFDTYRGYYIGQAKTSMQRIIQHFKKPNSAFDMLYGANEVSAIYAMPYVSEESLMDELEADCISMISPAFLLNCTPNSGNSLGHVCSIHDDLYNPMDFRMSASNHKKAIKTLFRIKSNAL